MGRVIPTNAAQPQSTRVVVLDGVEYRIDFTWRERLAGWYFDLYASDDTPLALGLRLSPGWVLGKGLSIPDGPPGRLFVRGPDDYVRADLGAALRVVYYPLSELPDPPEEDEAPTVVIA